MIDRTARYLLITALITASAMAGSSTLESAGASPFYRWDALVPGEPGDLLRQEPLEPELVLAEASTGLRILYVSESFTGGNTVVSGDVFIPKGDAPAGGWPVLAWSHGTVGVADACAPSFRGRADRDIAYLNQWLAAGYAIVATDYEGLGTRGTHPYLHCRSEANGNTDAVAAAHQLALPLAKQWLVMGQSQGGQAALCTGAYAGQRSGELEFLGVLATAPGVNFMQRFKYGKAEDPNPYLGISLLLARGFETYEPGFDREQAFTDQALALMHHTDSLCVHELIGIGYQAGLTSGQSMKHMPFSETPGVASAAEKMEIPLTGWQQPVYIAQGTNDELVRYQDVYDFGADLCAQGVAVTLDVFENADHSGPMNTGFDDFKLWVEQRFAGDAANNNCAQIDALLEQEADQTPASTESTE